MLSEKQASQIMREQMNSVNREEILEKSISTVEYYRSKLDESDIKTKVKFGKILYIEGCKFDYGKTGYCDKNRAIQLYEESVSCGNQDAKMNLGILYNNEGFKFNFGFGQDTLDKNYQLNGIRDIKLATTFYKKSIELDNKDALRNLDLVDYYRHNDIGLQYILDNFCPRCDRMGTTRFKQTEFTKKEEENFFKRLINSKKERNGKDKYTYHCLQCGHVWTVYL